MPDIYLNRDLEDLIPTIIKNYKVISITGPRQAGKTTLIKHIFKEYKYFNLEDFETLEKIQTDPKSIINKENLPFIIDEAQKAPKIFSQIQVLADECKEKGQIIISGSSNLLLMEQVTQSLAGRVAILHLFPLTYNEMIKNHILFGSYNQIFFAGSYPEIYSSFGQYGLPIPTSILPNFKNIKLNAEIEPEITRFYKNYINTYISKDIASILNVKDAVTFYKLLKLLAFRSAQLLKLEDLANSLDKSHTTIKEWINNLSITFAIFYLRPYYNNFGKRLIKTPKLYFYDTGMLSYLANIQNSKNLNLHPLYGQIFENFVIADYIKTAYHMDTEPNAFFWRNSSNKEIDLLIEKNQTIHAIEIKSAKTFHSKLLKNLDYFKELKPNAKTYLIYGGSEKFTIKGHVIYPISKINELWLRILNPSS